MDICADALIRFAERHAEKARELARSRQTRSAEQELERIAEVCTHVPAHAPRDFWEALQYYWFVHLGVTTELNPWDAFCPGKLDQHLLPFYEARPGRGDTDAGAGRGAAAVLLDQVQQPARAAQGGRHRRGEQHLHRLCPDQHRRRHAGWLRRGQRGYLPDPGCDRGDAVAAAQLIHPGQQKEPRSLCQACRAHHPHRIWPALRVQQPT